jgi:[protein-PII] uridylyltransferase
MATTTSKRHADLTHCERLATELSGARETIFVAQPPIAGLDLMRRHADILDGVMAGVFSAAMEAASLSDKAHRKVDASLAVVATGGYGRRELAPFSDVDVTFISAVEDDPDVDRVVKEAFHLLMDVILDRIGLKIGYAYRVLDDYQTLDHITRTALLDSRPIAGNPEIVDTFTRDLRETLDAGFALTHVRSRAADAPTSALYAVEPNVKSGPGGLREIQVAGWIGQALFDCGPDEVWREMVDRRVLAKDQALELEMCRNFLSSVRNALHLSADRQLDVLTVERQPEVAALLGLSSEGELMDRHYACTEKVRWICGALTQALVNRRLPLDKLFFLTNGTLALADNAVALQRPGVIARAFRHAQSCGVGFSAQLEEQIRSSVQVGAPRSNDKQSYVEFRSILDGENVYATLAHLASLGVLQRLIPEFGALLHRVPAERVHEYTIGEHSLRVLHRLEEMRVEQDTLYSGLWASVRDPAALLFAALMHDVGKIRSSGEDHTEIGAEMAETLARRIGFAETSVATIKFLVASHELMSSTARRCDVNSVAIVAEFATAVHDVHRLRKLFLLSVADALSVGQHSYGDMQRRFLEELYFAAESEMLGPRTDDEADRADRYRRRLERTLSLANLPEDMVNEHCDVMPPTYLLNTRPERMAAHIEAVSLVRAGTPVVRLDEDLEDHITELTVCAPDTGPGLLSQIAGVLYALDITVHSAVVFTRSAADDIAIDTLSIDYLQGRLPYFKRKEVERELLRVLTHEITVEDLLRARGKFEVVAPVKSVQLLGRHSETHSMVEVRADDTDGLLYHLTCTIARVGWNILSARITTRGHMAIDTFAVRDPSRGRLPSSAASTLKHALNEASKQQA